MSGAVREPARPPGEAGARGPGIPRSGEAGARPAGVPPGRSRRWKRRWVIAAVVPVAAAMAVAAAVNDPLRSPQPGSSGVADNSFPISTVAVKRQTVTQQTSVPATLGYAGSYQPVNQAAGTYTALPAVGQVVSPGQVLYRVDADPVVLLHGATPAYRTLSAGATGADVTELNTDLVALGYLRAAELDSAPDTFGYGTEVGVEKLQATLGVSRSGSLRLGQVVFLPSAVRVTAVSAQLGGPARAGQPVLEGTSTSREVTVELDAARQSEVKVGDRVTITLPDNATTPGTVTSVGTVAATPPSAGSGSGSGGGSGTPTVTVEVTPTDPAATGRFDQAPVQVLITDAAAEDVLAVPVESLVALSGGGTAVEVVGRTGIHHLVDVSVGLFDDAADLVQVTGAGLRAGERVVVPST